MNENQMQIVAGIIVVNLVAWGGFMALQDDDTKEYIDRVIYQQPDVDIANVTVTIDYNGMEANATANTNITTVSYNVTVINDTSAFNATVEASKGNFGLKFTWYSSFNGAFIDEIDGVPGSPCYWELIYNGNSSSVGASSLILQENDSITWKYNTDWC